MKVSNLVRVSLLSAISFVLMFFPKLPFFFIPFIDLDLSDIPSLIAAIAMGPVFGVLVELFKNLLYFITSSSTGGVGEFANFVVGVALVLPVGILMKNNKTNRRLLEGLILGTISMAIVACIMNYFILLPFYAKFLGMDINGIIEWVAPVNSFVKSKMSLVIYGVLPANIIKAVIVSIFATALYRVLGPQLMKLNIIETK